ncbi:Rne/Rng family ribonuclease, partial [Nocardioides sp. YIM 152588]|uniref:Rne/Rng family ribonuclease n=1 Tax=Nocardioides sp. YIM 152588 TaxID=3158259 RepID=UPI0032E50D27
MNDAPTTTSHSDAEEPATAPAAEAPASEAPATEAPAAEASAEAPAAESGEAPPAKKATRKAPAKRTTKKATAKKAAAEPVAAAEGGAEAAEDEAPAEPPAKKAAAKKAPAKKAAAKKTTTRKTAAKKPAPAAEAEQPAEAQAEKPAEEQADEASATLPLFQAPAAPTTRKRAPRKKAAAPAQPEPAAEDEEAAEDTAAEASEQSEASSTPDAAEAASAQDSAKDGATDGATDGAEASTKDESEDSAEGDAEDGDADEGGEESAEGSGAPRRRRRRGGRRRRKSGGSGSGESEGDRSGGDSDQSDRADQADQGDASDAAEGDKDDAAADSEGERSEGSGTSRRRRRRRREGEGGADAGDDPQNTVTRVRKARSAEDEITAVSGSTRLEAKKQRRREGREAGRRRAPIISEAEFLARRESVERVMVVRQREDVTQIGVLEDKVLVEHYVARESQTSLIGNVYLGRVQNVLPSMEAAFIDIGKGRNAVLYAGEVNWSALGHKDGQPRKIESVLSSGQTVLVQVTKDPIGHKGARLTSQISLAGRFLVYVPDGTTSGISRKLPDTERARLKSLLKEIVPETAGVIVRTAAEGAAEEELTRDVERLKARWEDIEAKTAKGSNAPQLLYGEPDLTLKVVRDLFTEDFAKLVVQGDDAWETVSGYVEHVAPDLAERLEHHRPEEGGGDVFSTYRIDEQISKGLDRKVWLPSGGSLIIDRTEAMTVVDVNTGKFTGSGGNLEETVTKNNLEAAEEIVRQLRLRDIGGIIVVDFIDMVLESNRDLVLRRLVECLGRDRTRHQVAEVTSLGLVQMTRKRIGTGLLEAFSETCTHCQGRGLVVHDLPIEPKRGGGDGGGDGESRRGRRRRGKGQGDGEQGKGQEKAQDKSQDKPQGRDKGDGAAPEPHANGNGNGAPSPKVVAAMAMSHPPVAAEDEATGTPEATPAAEAPTPEAPEAPPAEAPAAEAPPAEAPAAEAPAAEAPAAEAPAPEAAPEEPAPAEPAVRTTVVTRTRRRAASRPA